MGQTCQMGGQQQAFLAKCALVDSSASIVQHLQGIQLC